MKNKNASEALDDMEALFKYCSIFDLNDKVKLNFIDKKQEIFVRLTYQFISSRYNQINVNRLEIID